MKAANDIFFNDYQAKFTLEHTWRELSHDQKWCSTSSAKDGGKSKRRMLNEGFAQFSSSQPGNHGEDEAMGRLPYVNATKAKAKRSASKTTTMEEAGKSLLEFQIMWTIKQHDLAMKEKLFKNKLLDSLLAKSEPLSDIEMALKTN